jgi:magnesium transporter
MPSLPKPRFGRSARVRADGTATESLADAELSHAEILDLAPGDGERSLRWVNIERPQASDRAWLEERFEFHPLDIDDVFSRNQRPKIDEYPDYLFIVLHFPRYDAGVQRLAAAELDLFVGPDYLITLPNVPIGRVEYLFQRCRADAELRRQFATRGSGYLLYRVIDSCVDDSFPMLGKIGAKLDHLEDDIYEGRSEEIVRDISRAKQEIINFRTIVRPQRPVIGDLERSKQRFLTGELDVYFDDINDASERIWQMLEGYKETVEALEASNESALAHQGNNVFRVLTALSLAVLPLTLVASIWGMNVGVPGEGDLNDFWVIIGCMAAILVGTLWFFRRRGWL